MDHLQFINKMIIFIQLEGFFFFFDLTCSQNKKGSTFIENKHPFFPCLQTSVVSLHTQRNALVTLNWKLCVRVYVCIYIPKTMDLCVCEGIYRTGHLCSSWHRGWERDQCSGKHWALLFDSASHLQSSLTFCHLPQQTFHPLSPSNQAELHMDHSWLLLLHPQLPLGPKKSSSDQEQALGTCISCLLNLRYEKGHVGALLGVGWPRARSSWPRS